MGCMGAPDTFTVNPRMLEHLGLPRFELLCERARVEPSATLRTDAFFRLWWAAEQAITDRAVGLRLGAEGIQRGYSVAGRVALHAPDLRSALAALGRYKRLTCPETVEVECDAGEARVRYRWLQADGEVPRLLVDLTLASLLQLTVRGTGGRVTPMRVELARQTMDVSLLQEHFACPVVFGAPHDAMVFEASALDVPFVSADGGAFARLVDGLEARLRAGQGYVETAADVRVAIARQLSEGRRPTLEAVARRMTMSVRTLQRRLDAGETSFQVELAAVRRTTACRLLANTDLDSVAIAMLLGFVEHNSFARAFRQWERTTPLRWREQHALLLRKEV